jgi:DNA-binding MarR family transcriptional regulator
MDVELPIPSEIATLLNEAILSIEELEVLLRLRADRESRTASDLADALNIPEAIAESALESLERAGFLSGAPRGKHRAYAFSPRSDALAASVEALVAYYRDNRMQVILSISSNAIERLRNGVLQRFSDAFRLSLDKKDG